MMAMEGRPPVRAGICIAPGKSKQKNSFFLPLILLYSIFSFKFAINTKQLKPINSC